jgi:uncharacterized repeat protein (TIGR01451 family)
MLWAHTLRRYRAAILAGLLLALLGVALRPGDAVAATAASGTADLTIVSNTSSVSRATVGDQVTFTIVATNNGPDSATLRVDTAEASTALSGGHVTCYGVNHAPGPSADGTLCEYGVLQPGDTVTETIVETVRATGSADAIDTACVDPAPDQSSDPNPSDDCATATVRIDGPVSPPVADLAIVSDTPDVTHATTGQQLTFTIVARNNGPDPAELSLSDLQAWSWDSLRFVSRACIGPSNLCAMGQLPVLQPGDTYTETVSGQVQAPGNGYASDTACASSPDSRDPNSQNDCGTGIVRIDNAPPDGTGTPTGGTTGTGGKGGTASGSAGGATGPVGSMAPTSRRGRSAPASMGACRAYTRRVGRHARSYTIRVHHTLSCGQSRAIIRRADAKFTRLGAAVTVSSWLCREHRLHATWVDTCNTAGGAVLTWTERLLSRPDGASRRY